MKTRKPARRGTAAGGRESGEWALAQHRAQCRICRHADREEIEREFLDWTSPREIAATWKIASYRAVYRHAHATGLFEQRRRNWHGALEKIIERVSEVQVTASAVIAAIRLSVQLDRQGSEGPGRRPQPRFLLSLDGLPRTDAVMSNPRPVAQAEPVPEQPRACAARDRAVEAGSKPAPTSNGGKRTQDSGGKSASQRAAAAEVMNQKRESRADNAADAEPAPKESEARSNPPEQIVPAKAAIDPRIALSEDGRVAGMPWPWKEKKITFAPRRRWRPGYNPST